MGPARLNDFAHAMGIDLTTTGFTATQLVDCWRDARPLIAGERIGEYQGRPARTGGLWKGYHEAFKAALRGETGVYGRCVFQSSFGNVEVRLPSGRRLIYRHARMEELPPPWGGDPRPTVVYDGAYGMKVITPGALTENITQAVCRDLLAHALTALEEEGLPTILHVHDEIVGDHTQLDRMIEIMSKGPPWAEGFPIAAEGFIAPAYVKTPWESML
jgi:DNA polymerase